MKIFTFHIGIRSAVTGTLFCSYIILTGCTSANIADVRSSIGQNYHVLQFPVMQHNIGSEWSKQFNATGKGSLTEDKIMIEKSLQRLDKGTANQVALGISALSPSGLGGGTGGEAKLTQQINLHDLQIVKPVSLGYISFKPGINYVTQALRLEGFSIESEKNLKFQANATGTPDKTAANFGVEAGANNSTGGEGLVIGYLVQTVDTGTYTKTNFGPVDITLDNGTTPVGQSNITVSAAYEKVAAGSGKSLPKNLLWACRRAANRKDSINAAWVVTLNIPGDEKKTLRIACPAQPEIEDCDEFEGVISTTINSVSDKIERTIARISVKKAAVNEMIDPVDFSGSASITKESFKVKTITPEP